eukprot:539036-Amphidinium_carterae.1
MVGEMHVFDAALTSVAVAPCPTSNSDMELTLSQKSHVQCPHLVCMTFGAGKSEYFSRFSSTDQYQKFSFTWALRYKRLRVASPVYEVAGLNVIRGATFNEPHTFATGHSNR